MESILYYPNINLPNNDWLLKAVLYWDRISSIVPDEYQLNPNEEMQMLIDKGIYQPTYPSQLFSSYEFHDKLINFEEDVLNAVQPKYSICGSQNNITQKALRNIHKSKIYWPDLCTAIHYNKLSGNLYDYLKQKKLIEVTSNSEWLMMDERTASIYMSILAKYLAEISSVPTVLGTDQNKNLYTAYNRSSQNEKNFCISICLNEILPTPAPNTSIKKIVRFKEKRRLELLYFRDEISRFENEIAKCSSVEEINKKIICFKRNLETTILEQKQMMKDERIDCVFSTLKTLCSTSTPGLMTLISEQIGATPRWLTISMFGLGGMIGIGCDFVKYKKDVNSNKRGSGFAYVYDAANKGIIKPSGYTVTI